MKIQYQLFVFSNKKEVAHELAFDSAIYAFYFSKESKFYLESDKIDVWLNESCVLQIQPSMFYVSTMLHQMPLGILFLPELHMNFQYQYSGHTLYGRLVYNHPGNCKSRFLQQLLRIQF